MAKTILGGADVDAPANLNTASVSRFHPLGMGAVWAASTETIATRKQRAPGKLSRLGVNVVTNARTSSTTFVARVNGADGTNSVAVGSGATGWFEDTSHSDTLASGDDLCLKSLTGAGAGTLALFGYSASFEADTGTVADYGWTAAGPTAGVTAMRFSTASSSFFVTGIAGRTLNTTVMYATETVDARFKVRSPGTLSHCFARVLTNARTTDSTVTLRINSADATNTFTIPLGTTGLFEDTSHADSIVADDEVCMKGATGAGAGNLDFVLFGCKYESFAVSSQDLMAASNNESLPSTAAQTFCPVMGYSKFTVTEAQTRINAPYAFSWWKPRIRIGSNAGGANTFVNRINGADGTLSIAIPATTTGFFEDTSHADSVAQGDTINYRLPTSTSLTVQFRQITALADPGGSGGQSSRGRRLNLSTF